MKRFFVIAALFIAIFSFQNCSKDFNQFLANGIGNGEPHQGIECDSGDVEDCKQSAGTDVDQDPETATGATDRPPAKSSDETLAIYSLADETNGCGGATTKAVKVQAMIRITRQGVNWEKYDCRPAAGKSTSGLKYFESRMFNTAVVDSRVLQGTQATITSMSRSGMHDVYCTNAPGDQAPPAGQPVIEILLQKHADALDAEKPGRAFTTGANLDLKRKVNVRILRNRFDPFEKYAFAVLENRPKGALEVAGGNKNSATSNYIDLKAPQALLSTKTTGTVTMRMGGKTYRNIGLRCYRNRNNL